jgi:aspartokinase-like uncharacterized kinase
VRIPWVVKLGGSLWASPLLPRWLEQLAAGNVIIVPGGGLFADAVRRAQDRWGFDDHVAHAMAISAMTQYGQMLQGLCRELRVATERQALLEANRVGRSIIWLPDPRALENASLRASWDVTSDSLAAWLARQLAAEHLLLVKSRSVPTGACRLSDLVAEGLLDPAFPETADSQPGAIWVSGPEHPEFCEVGLMNPSSYFTRVMTNPG